MQHTDDTSQPAPSSDLPQGPLTGYRVVDISHHMAGPSATQRLGDLGADVIKVEPPGTGEWSRTRTIADSWVGDMSTSFLSLNCNKRAIGINLKSADGYEILLKLLADADVFVTNFRPEVGRRLRVDYESLRKVNARLVYCSITGFGETGPNAGRPGQDLIIQAYSGLAWNGGSRDDPPTPASAFVADATTGNHAVIGILAALLARQSTDRGQHIEVDLLSSILDVQTQELTTYLNTGRLPQRPRERLAHPLINSPYGIHRTVNGWVAVAMAEAVVLAEALDAPELLRFSDWSDGSTHRDEIFRAVAAALAKLSTEEAIEQLDKHAIWCGRVNTYADLVDDPQIIHSKTIQTIQSSDGSDIRVLRSPIRFSDVPDAIRSRPPELGEHTLEILSELGIDKQDAVRLRATGAIQ